MHGQAAAAQVLGLWARQASAGRHNMGPCHGEAMPVRRGLSTGGDAIICRQQQAQQPGHDIQGSHEGHGVRWRGRSRQLAGFGGFCPAFGCQPTNQLPWHGAQPGMPHLAVRPGATHCVQGFMRGSSDEGADLASGRLLHCWLRSQGQRGRRTQLLLLLLCWWQMAGSPAYTAAHLKCVGL